MEHTAHVNKIKYVNVCEYMYEGMFTESSIKTYNTVEIDKLDAVLCFTI